MMNLVSSANVYSTRVGVEVLVDVVAAIMAAAQRLGLDRPGVLHPAAMVDDVDVEVAEAAAAGPEEAVEAPNLVGHFGDVGRLRRRLHRSDRAVHAVAAHQNEVADFAVVDALGQFLRARGCDGTSIPRPP